MNSRQIRNQVRGASLSYAPYDNQNNDDDDHIYIEVNMKYDPDKDVGQNSSLATYQQTKTEPIIKNPSEYYLFIDRFDISGFLIPIQIFDPLAPGQVALEYLGVKYTANVAFTPRTLTTPITDPTYYYLYDYQHYLDMINTALVAAYALIPGPPAGSIPPYIVWETNAQKFSIFAQSLYYDINIANPIKIFLDDVLVKLFPFIPYFEETAALWQVYVQSTYNNRVAVPAGSILPNDQFFEMKQQAVGTSYWNDAKSIVFTSQSIPIKNTFTELNSIQQQNSNATTLGIIIDYRLLSDQALDYRKQILYVPSQNYRRLDLYGTTPLRTIDMQVYWTNGQGQLFPLRIPRSQDFNIKLLFQKKTYFQ